MPSVCAVLRGCPILYGHAYDSRVPQGTVCASYVTGVNDGGGGLPGVKPGLWAALLDSRRFHSVVSGAVSTRNTLDPALGRRMGPKGPFYPSGSHYAIWGKVSNVAFYVNVESETFGYWHDNATSAHERLVSNKAARIDRWCSEVAQWLLLPQHPAG